MCQIFQVKLIKERDEEMEFSKEFVDKVMNCVFFTRCGEKDDFDFEVEYVKTVDKAVKQINSTKWENTYLEAANEFSVFMVRNHMDDFSRANDIIKLAKQKYLVEMGEKVKKAWSDEESKDSIWMDVSFIMVKLFSLDHYSEYFKSEFYEHLLEVYLSGHLPCGWKGKYPQGKLIVF